MSFDSKTKVIFKGVQHFPDSFREMLEFTQSRSAQTVDQIWVLQHYPVYTLGSNRTNAIRPDTDIPFHETDRGGQITYHGPGQLVLYLLLDLKTRQLGIRQFVGSLEQAIIDLLSEYHIRAETWIGNPGVYVDQAKIASVGLRVRGGCSYHGISLNVNMDLEPFEDIVVCGQHNLRMTQIADLGGPDHTEQLALPLINQIDQKIGLGLIPNEQRHKQP
ncbi:MAG: lipoyl(octanoyl) transferase LipB [Gammaproteobacteria bacterium]|nr:lipoyl(octanoyl) transferase LipB [Gammaproteobacteria bacterium]